MAYVLKHSNDTSIVVVLDHDFFFPYTLLSFFRIKSLFRKRLYQNDKTDAVTQIEIVSKEQIFIPFRIN